MKCSTCGFEIHSCEGVNYCGDHTTHRSAERCVWLVRNAAERVEKQLRKDLIEAKTAAKVRENVPADNYYAAA